MIWLLPLTAANNHYPRCLLCGRLPPLGLAHDLVATGIPARSADGCCVCIACGSAQADDAGHAERLVRRRLRQVARRVALLRRKATARRGGVERRTLDDAEVELACVRQVAGRRWVCLGLDLGLWGARRLAGPWSAEQRKVLRRHLRDPA